MNAILQALAIGSLPDVEWLHGDDLCDCTFQRIGQWTNPYLAETVEIRLCCVWAELSKQYPEFFRTIPGFKDDNTGEWITEPREWDGEAPMPVALWHRQLAKLMGTDLADIRGRGFPAPSGKLRHSTPLFLPHQGEWVEVELT